MSEERHIEKITPNGFTADYKFIGDEVIYEQVSNEPLGEGITRVGLITKGTLINKANDNRFYITVKSGK